ncbi:MAG: glycosyltransferase family 4 protein [Sedimentisphaerales bacterium]|nr:glycosyltransferase family 4 protein [Sedimentisphaerales bacterium]
MNEKANSDTARMRKSLRPVLIVSSETVREHTPFLRHLLVGLASESLATVLIRPPGCDTEPLVPAPVTVLTHPLLDMPLTEHFGIERLVLQLEKCRPTVLHCLSETRMGLARRLARRLNLPYVQAVNSLSERFSRIAVSSQHCRAIAVPTETVRATVARACFRFADRIRQINIGTCVEREPVCFSEPSRLPSIVMAQPFRRVSDFENVFQAIKALLAEGREFVVVVMGPGAGEHRLRRFLAQHDLTPVVTIVPTLHPWRCVLAAADIFVQPQPLRAFSVFLLEAMGLGTAVAACLGGVDDMIIPNQTAVVFEPDSEPSIHRALAQLLDQHDLARRLARTAQEHVRARYSASTMISDTLKTYTEAQQQYHR